MHGSKRDARRREMPEADVVLTTYPLVLRDLEHLRDHEFHLLILDEAQGDQKPAQPDQQGRLCAVRKASTVLVRHAGGK